MEDPRLKYSGGEVLRGTEVWNRDPLPKPKPKVYLYKLTAMNDKYDVVATATSMEELISFELQLRDLGYEFIKLERMEEME